MIRVLLADDQALVRAGFRAILETADGITVVAEAADGAEAVALARRHHPDVILMDIRMPGTDGLEATRQICATTAQPGPRVVILTTYEADEYVYAAIKAGASGFLVKDTEPWDLFHAIRVVAEGEALLSPRVTRRLIADIAGRPEPPSVAGGALSGLTDREREVLTLVAAGLSNTEIAARLSLSPHTAKTHVNRAMTKLDARDRAQLVIIAYETGLVRPPRA
ncbi:MAG: response regulator transcription factor [Streptomyces sp.]|nr:response regulator transcription factor [Streptomyces sp.]